MSEEGELTIKAAELARFAGPRWDEFVKAMEAYATAQMKNCVRAPSNEILVMQGHARQCSELVDLFRNAVGAADRLSKKQQDTAKPVGATYG